MASLLRVCTRCSTRFYVAGALILGPLAVWLAVLGHAPQRDRSRTIALVQDGAWTWFNDPRAVCHNGTLYVGHVEHATGNSALTAVRLSSLKASKLWSSSWSVQDDHNNLGLLPLADGRLVAFYTRHYSTREFYVRISNNANPTSPKDWGDEQAVSTVAIATYSNPYQIVEGSNPCGRIYNFHRGININPAFVFSDDLGKNWSAPQILIKTGRGRTRAYVKYCSDYAERIDLLYTDGHPNSASNSIYHAFLQDLAIHRSDGSILKRLEDGPLLHDAGERGTLVYQYSDAPSHSADDHITSGRAWCWEVVCTPQRAPICVFTVQRDHVTGGEWYDDRIYYYYARWTGTGWQKRFIAHAGRPLCSAERDYAGGICIAPDHPEIVYVSSNAARPFDLTSTIQVPLRGDQRYLLYRGVTSDGGLTFAWELLTPDARADNLRPYVPRFREGRPIVLWMQGIYESYSSFETSIVGRFDERLVGPISQNAANPAEDSLIPR